MGHLQFIAQQPFYSHIFFIYINSVLNQHCFASAVQVRESPFAGDCSNSAARIRELAASASNYSSRPAKGRKRMMAVDSEEERTVFSDDDEEVESPQISRQKKGKAASRSS
jgi:hypothetical protein